MDQDNTWVVMEYATGEIVGRRRAPKSRRNRAGRRTGLMQGIAAGVAYLHNHGIVHRDLKPGNVFQDEGLIKLGDYGLSKFISCSRRSGQTDSVGTVHYMALRWLMAATARKSISMPWASSSTSC